MGASNSCGRPTAYSLIARMAGSNRYNSHSGPMERHA